MGKQKNLFLGIQVAHDTFAGDQNRQQRELDFRYWMVFAIVPLRTSNREKKGDLVLLPFAARRCEASEAFARFCIASSTFFR